MHSSTDDVSDSSEVAARLLPVSSSGFTVSDILPRRASQEQAASDEKSAELETLLGGDVRERNGSGAVGSDYAIATVDSDSDSSTYVISKVNYLPPDMWHPAGSPSHLRRHDDCNVVESAD